MEDDALGEEEEYGEEEGTMDSFEEEVGREEVDDVFNVASTSTNLPGDATRPLSMQSPTPKQKPQSRPTDPATQLQTSKSLPLSLPLYH